MNRLAEQLNTGLFTCPYGCNSTYTQMSHLTQHIRDSSEQLDKYGAEHEDRKREDGWYEPGWDPRPEGKGLAVARQKRMAEQAASLPYASYHIAHQEKGITYQGRDDIIYYSGQEAKYADVGLLYFGEEEDSIITSTINQQLSSGEPTIESL
jgi:hypothetical protein